MSLWNNKQKIGISKMSSLSEDKKFIPDHKPIKETKLSSLYRVTDQNESKFYAKFFLQKKLVELNIFESTEYNQTVLSDLSDQMFPEHFLEIKYTYATNEGFIFVTDPYEMTLDSFLKNRVVEEKEAMSIFEQIVKAIYSLYISGFWHRNIRPEHFVKVGNTWKLESLVFNENYKEANGIESEYLWNPAYQPPEAYDKMEFGEEELDEMIVWNLGSLLVDMLLSHHKLKDKTVLSKFESKPFSFKALGVRKVFSKQVSDLLEKMLSYNRKDRMTVTQLFACDFISREISRLSKNGEHKKARIYMPGHSNLSKRLAASSDRSQQILNISNFKTSKQQNDHKYSAIVNKPNENKIESNNELLDKIKILNQEASLQTISEDTEDSEVSRAQNYKKIGNLMSSHKHQSAIEAYKCYYDKCELLLIASRKIEQGNYLKFDPEHALLNKYAIVFTSMMFMHRLAESMNRNINFLELEPEEWSDFQESDEFKGFKEIVNFRQQERKHILVPIREKLDALRQDERNMMKNEKVQDLVHSNHKMSNFDSIKVSYRKILKQTYDEITRAYNQKKTQELAKIGMYVTYCMTIDKLYIPSDISDNFMPYFEWNSIPATSYVPIDTFQDYLDNADRVSLVSHSSFILRKYFALRGPEMEQLDHEDDHYRQENDDYRQEAGYY